MRCICTTSSKKDFHKLLSTRQDMHTIPCTSYEVFICTPSLDDWVILIFWQILLYAPAGSKEYIHFRWRGPSIPWLHFSFAGNICSNSMAKVSNKIECLQTFNLSRNVCSHSMAKVSNNFSNKVNVVVMVRVGLPIVFQTLMKSS